MKFVKTEPDDVLIREIWKCGSFSIVILNFLFNQSRVQVWKDQEVLLPNFCTYDSRVADSVVQDMLRNLNHGGPDLETGDENLIRSVVEMVGTYYGWDGQDARCRVDNHMTYDQILEKKKKFQEQQTAQDQTEETSNQKASR